MCCNRALNLAFGLVRVLGEIPGVRERHRRRAEVIGDVLRLARPESDELKLRGELVRAFPGKIAHSAVGRNGLASGVDVSKCRSIARVQVTAAEEPPFVPDDRSAEVAAPILCLQQELRSGVSL